MEWEESLLKLEELRKSSNNGKIKEDIEKLQQAMLKRLAEPLGLKLD